MSQNLPDFSNLSICVIGDIMLDEYLHGATQRISPEAPVPVVLKSTQNHCLGGAANVANNLAKLGVKASLAGILGEDEAGETIRQTLKAQGINDHCLYHGEAQTIHKLRIMSRSQQLLRIDKEQPFSSQLSDQLISQLMGQLENFDAIILSDYAKGTLQKLSTLISTASAKGIPVIVDPKGQDFTKYTGASAITPNLSEFEAIQGKSADNETFNQKAQALKSELKLDALIVTLSEKGVALFESDHDPMTIPTQAREVYDVTGAGDTVIAVISASLAAGLRYPQAVKLGNIAAGIVVGKLGTAYVTPDELQKALENRPETGIFQNAESLIQALKPLRAAGEKIVMTNGCFDLLHPGHIRYLKEAAELGDRLIVAVNSDESVKRLKGPQRPINTLQDRMTMLYALKGIDFVLPFEQDTPQQLIAAILPDVLVKGGDYIAEEIVGYKEVTDHGGEVRILSFEEGYSSTNLIEKISER